MSRRRILGWTLGVFVLLLLGVLVIRLLQSSNAQPVNPDLVRLKARQLNNLSEPQIPQPKDAKVAASPPALIGDVIDDLSGRRIPGIAIHLHAQESKRFVAESVSDGAGSYQVSVPPGAYLVGWFRVDLESDLIERMGSGTVQIPTAGPPIRLDLHMHAYPLVVYEGRVLDRKTELPVKGAKLFLSIETPVKPKGERDDPKKREATPRFINTRDFLSDETGSFRISGTVQPGQYWVHASHPNYEPFFGDLENQGIRVVDGVAVQRFSAIVHLNPEILATLKGRFLSKEGLPVVGGAVTIGNGDFLLYATTDAQGCYEARVTPESVRVTHRHPEYRTLRFDLGSVNPGEKPEARFEDIPRTLERKPLQVSFSVVSTDDSPVAIQGMLVGEDDPSGHGNPTFSVPMRTDGNGVFYAEQNLGYAFLLPSGSGWKVLSVTSTQPVQQKGMTTQFRSPETQVKVVVGKR